MEFLEAPAFTRHLQRYFEDDEIVEEAKRVRRPDGRRPGNASASRRTDHTPVASRPTLSLPEVDERLIRTTRERLHMSRAAFAHRLGVNPRTLERWEQGRSKPNDQAAALILLVRKYPDTLSRLETLSAAG